MELSDWLVDRLLAIGGLVNHLWVVYKSSVGVVRKSFCRLSVGVRPAPVYVCHKFAVSVFLIASKTHLNAF